MSETTASEKTCNQEEFQFPADLLTVNIQQEFYDKFSSKQLNTLLGPRLNWIPEPRLKWAQEILRYCASRWIRILRQEARRKHEILMIPVIYVIDKNKQGLDIFVHCPFAETPRHIFSEFLKDDKYAIGRLFADDLTETVVNKLKNNLKPIGCRIPEINIHMENEETYSQDKHEDGKAMDILLQIANVKFFYSNHSTPDVLNFKGSRLELRAPSISTQTLLTMLKVPPTSDRPLKTLNLTFVDKTIFNEVVREGNVRHVFIRRIAKTEVLLDFGSDETQWLCTSNRYYDDFIVAEFLHIPKH